jgi:hypothetical protein
MTAERPFDRPIEPPKRSPLPIASRPPQTPKEHGYSHPHARPSRSHIAVPHRADIAEPSRSGLPPPRRAGKRKPSAFQARPPRRASAQPSRSRPREFRLALPTP